MNQFFSLKSLAHFEYESSKYHQKYRNILQKFLIFPSDYVPSCFQIQYIKNLIDFCNKNIEEFVSIAENQSHNFNFDLNNNLNFSE